MLETLSQLLSRLIHVPGEGMVHPGLPPVWVVFILFAMLLIGARAIILSQVNAGISQKSRTCSSLPFFGQAVHSFITRPWLLALLRIFTAVVFLLVIYAGLFGTAIPERNIATVLTWTIWWSGVVISVFFAGSAWCAICPWDAIASWLVKRKLWRRGEATTSLNLKVPKLFRNVWPALFMLSGLTWLELGGGITIDPYATSLLALLMVVLATVSLALYERKAFCRYFCAIGRTIGAYSSLSPVALRPVDENTCLECKTLECYHGTKDIEPCPTHLVMGRITQNTYCTSCGACVISCPHQNVSWNLRGAGEEITFASRPHWDEAWFIMGLLALTIFHGITMIPFWENWIRQLAMVIGDSGRLLTSFSIGMFLGLLVPVLLYVICIKLTMWSGKIKGEFHRIFSALAFTGLPLAFSYHIAHNLSHFVRESHGFWSVLFNPLGIDTQPLGMGELHFRHMNPLLGNDVIFAIQGGLVIAGFWLAVRIARQRILQYTDSKKTRFVMVLPILSFIIIISLINLWLLMQPMVIRM